MNIAEAHEAVGSRVGDPLEKIEQRYRVERQVWEGKLGSALLPKHVEQCQKRVRELDDAIEVLRRSLGATVTHEPTTKVDAKGVEAPIGMGDWIRVESGSSSTAVPEPAVNAARPVGESARVQRLNWASLGGRVPEEFRWLVPSIGASAALVIILLMLKSIARDPDSLEKRNQSVSQSSDEVALDVEKTKAKIDKMLKDEGPVGTVRQVKAVLSEQPDGPAVKALSEWLLTLLFERASDMFGRGENPKAIDYYQAMVELDPLHPLSVVAFQQLNIISKPQGRVLVTVGDSQAKVTLFKTGTDGEEMKVLSKNAPAEFGDLHYGIYTILVESDGYVSFKSGRLNISSGQLKELPVQLKRSAGGLKVTADVERAKFKVELLEVPSGVKKAENVAEDGFTTRELKDLPTGKYRVTFPEHGDSMEVDVEEGSVKELAVLLGPVTPTTGDSSTGGGSTGNSSDPFGGIVEGLDVTTDRTSYRDGEAVVVQVRIPRDGFLRVYSVDAEGSIAQVFPNDYEPENRVRGGEVRSIPGDGAQKPYRLKLSLPESLKSGQERVYAVFSDTQFTDEQLRDFENGSFPDHGKIGSGFSFSKGLSPEAVATAVAGVSSYEVSR